MHSARWGKGDRLLEQWIGPSFMLGALDPWIIALISWTSELNSRVYATVSLRRGRWRIPLATQRAALQGFQRHR